MQFDSLGKRLLNIFIPLAVYLGIGLAVLGIFGESDLLANLTEKAACGAVMGYIFFQDNKVIRWDKPRGPGIIRLLLVFSGAGACVGINLLFSLTGLTGLLSRDMDAVNRALYQDSLWLELLAVGIAAPVAEELLFRGVIYRRLRTWMNIFPAAILALFIFALIHGNLLQGSYAFVLGAVIIWAYERFHSIVGPMLVHGAANMMSVLATESYFVSNALQKHTVLWCLAGILVCAVSIGAVELFYRGIMREQWAETVGTAGKTFEKSSCK